MPELERNLWTEKLDIVYINFSLLITIHKSSRVVRDTVKAKQLTQEIIKRNDLQPGLETPNFLNVLDKIALSEEVSSREISYHSIF